MTVDDKVDIATRRERRLMFDVGWTKLVLIAMVALIAIGPKELPGVLRNVGQWMGKIRRLAAEFQSQFQEAMRQAEMEDLKKHADDLNSAARTLTEQPEGADERAHVSSNEAACPIASASEYPTAALPAQGGTAEQTDPANAAIALVKDAEGAGAGAPRS